MRRALAETRIEGIATTAAVSTAGLLERDEFRRGEVHTRFVEQRMAPSA